MLFDEAEGANNLRFAPFLLVLVVDDAEAIFLMQRDDKVSQILIADATAELSVERVDG